ncbi:MAG: DegV family protein [Anaerolineaceae bacterium]|nr:DegV family protein [Anaerolineaceae bacterium]
MSIYIVTDSTSDLPLDIINKYNITVIPCFVNINGESYLDGVEISRKEFYEQLPDAKQPPTTSALVQVYSCKPINP